MMVNSYPQLGWLAPQPKPAEPMALASPPTPSFDQQQLNAAHRPCTRAQARSMAVASTAR
jgi:hypothetical protein